MQDCCISDSCCVAPIQHQRPHKDFLGENREQFIRIISSEGMYLQQSSYGDASFAECSKLFSAVCRNSVWQS